jgi:hypothetical protein
MSMNIQQEIAGQQGNLDAVGVAPLPTLNPTPIYADPAMGPAEGTAPATAPGVTNAPDPAAAMAASAPKPPAAMQSGPPDPAQAFAASQPQYDTTTSRTEGSSGLSADAQKRAGARLDQVGSLSQKATDDEAAAKQARADYEMRATDQALSDMAQKRREAAAEAALNDHTTAEVDRRMQAASDWRPERKNMFGFGAGRGLAAAVAVIAGGWMQGRGQTSTNQFLPFVMKMIDDDVNDQVRTNSANIQMLREQKGDLKAAAAELKKRQLMLVDGELQAKSAAAAAKDPSVQSAIEAYKSASAAKVAEWDAEQRKALERTVTNQVSRVTSPRAAVQGDAPKERTAEQGKAQAAQDAVNSFGEKAGLQRDANGKWIVGKGPLPPALVERFNPFSNNEIKAHADAAVEAYGRMQSGGVIGPEERVAFQEQLGMGTLTRAELAARLNAAQNNIAARLRSQDEAVQQQRATIPNRYR